MKKRAKCVQSQREGYRNCWTWTHYNLSHKGTRFSKLLDYLTSSSDETYWQLIPAEVSLSKTQNVLQL